MKTIQRIYIYMVWLVSMELAIWASIHLGRTVFGSAELSTQTDDLASSSAFLLVALPISLLHWWLAKRRALSDLEERFARTRATFLYAASLAMGLPAVQNLLAIQQRLFAIWFKVDPTRVALGSYQTWTDNIIAVIVNLAAALWVHRVLRNDWQTYPQQDNYLEMRRVWRYLWLVYGIVLTVIGVGSLLFHWFSILGQVDLTSTTNQVNGISFLLVGSALWYSWWRFIQHNLSQPAEARSTFRLVMLYLLAFVSVVIALFSSMAMLNEAIQTFFEHGSWQTFFTSINEPLSVAIPTAGVWAFYSRVLKQDLARVPDLPRRAALRRIYHYLLALLGLGTTFAGLLIFVEPLAGLALGNFSLNNKSVQSDIASALAALVVGLPLWLRQWLPMRAEAGAQDEAGEHARRSTTRKAYLYIALFAGVMGMMGTGGSLVYQLFRALLDMRVEDLTVAWLVVTLALFTALLWYHWSVLRSDQGQAAGMLQVRQAGFKVAVIEAENNGFGDLMTEALQNEAPEVGVLRQMAGRPAPKEAKQADAIILPANLVTQTPPALRVWLEKYEGQRLVVPTASEDWVWIGLAETNLDPLRKYTAKLVRQLAEGETVKPTRFRYTWTVMGYFFAFQLAIMAIGILILIATAIIDLVA